MPRLSLYDLFPEMAQHWPYTTIPGLDEDSDFPSEWLKDINAAVELFDLRTVTSGGRVSISCQFEIKSAPVIEFRIRSIFPILFRLVNTETPKRGNLFVDIGPAGPEVIIEGLPVEILIPPDLIYGDPIPGPESIPEDGEEADPDIFRGLTTEEIATAKAGFANDPHAQFIILRDDFLDEGGATSVFTHLRMRVTPDLDIVLTTAAPISFGRCGFLNMPVMAIHDFQLIPSPHLSHNAEAKLLDKGNWIRHSIVPPKEGIGVFAMRSIEFNFQSKYLRRSIPADIKKNSKAEWVFEDIVLPFELGLIPLHFTAGVRQNMDHFDDTTDEFSFREAAASFLFLDALTIRIYKLFFRSMAEADGSLFALANLGFTFGDNDDKGEGEIPWEITTQLAEELTVRVGLTLLPSPTYPWWLTWRISDKVIIQPIRLLPGYSLKKRADGASFNECIELTGSFWIHEKNAKWNSDGSGAEPAAAGAAASDDGNGPAKDSPVKPSSPPGKLFSLLITDIGYRRGSFVLEKFSLPEGYGIKLGPVGLELFELGLSNEDSATYFSISGGLQIGEAKKFEGNGIWFKRMRFKIGGSEVADEFKLDGFSGRLAVKDVVKIEIGGYYTDEINAAENYHKEEFGFTGKLELNATGKKWVMALDLITGKLTELDSQESFRYFIAQFFAGHIPAGGFELSSIRVLLALNMAPKITDDDVTQGEMKYYNWQKTIDPLAVPGSRRLDAWKLQRDAFSVGAGFGLSFTGCSGILTVTAFFMYIKAPEDNESGFLIAIELFFGKPTAEHDNQRTPIAWGVLEHDYVNDRTSAQLGINLTMKSFVENAPSVLADLLKIKGTLFISNKPCSVALGRIDDQNSWFMVTFDIDLFGIARTYMMIGGCFEYLEGEFTGVGIVARLEGGIDAGCFGIFYYAGALFIWKSFKTGSSDYVVLIQAEVGGSVKLFWVLNFGFDIKAEVRYVGNEPEYKNTVLRIHISTSWWLPDISWSTEILSGDIEPGERVMATAPIAMVSSLHSPTGTNTTLHFESIKTGRLISINEVDALAIPEAQRLQRFATAIASATNPLEPIATDSTIIIKFSNPVDQSLGIGPVVDEWGTQLAGDEENHMKLNYRLTAISVRRRPRFGPDRVWTSIETHNELELISPETGEPIEGSVTFEQTNLSYNWDEDVQEDGKKVPVKLLINSDTPFSFTTEDTEADENIIHENPEWPCCGKSTVQWHWYNFRLEMAGVLNKRLRRVFHPANGFEIITADGLIIPKKLTDTGNPEYVAAFTITATKQVMRMVFDEDAILAGIFVSATIKDKGSVTLIAENTQGEPVLTITHHFSQSRSEWEYVTISGKSFRSVSIIADSYQRVWTLYMDMASWLSAADYEKNHIDKQSCSSTNPNRATDFAGNGGLFFLPNHEYEIAFTTEIAVRHNSTEWETRTCEEFAYFITKGLPGLNYTKNTGTEMTPYVQTPYPVMRPFIYAEEPVVLTLNEKYKLSLPISARRPGDLEEHIQMTNLRLVVKSNADEVPPKPWAEAPTDWITAKARSRPVVIKGDYRKKTARSISTDVRLKRLSTLRNLSTAAGCTGSNVLDVRHSILAAFPSDKSIGGIKYWDKEKQCTAYLQLDNQIYIEHSSFIEEDLAGFDYSTHTQGAWTVKDRKLVASGMTSLETARFGEADWNYFNLSTEISGLDGEAGFIVAQNSAPVTHLYVLCSNTPEGITLKIYRTYIAPLIAEYHFPAAETIALRITAYDDLLAVTMNGETVTVPRAGAASGYCAFAVKGKAMFSNLYAEPLPMYAFNFRVSQFNSFSEHIADFETRPYSSLMSFYTDFRAARVLLQPVIDKVMNNSFGNTEREAVFVKLAAVGGIFVGENIGKSRITCLVTNENDCAAMLIESPESLDLAIGELKCKLAKKFIVEETKPLPGLTGLQEILAAAKQSAGGHVMHSSFINELILPGLMEATGLHRVGSRLDVLNDWMYNQLISSIVVTKGRNKNELSIKPAYTSLLPLLPAGKMMFLQYDPSTRELKIYNCVAEGRKKMTATFKESVTIMLRDTLAGLKQAKLMQMIVIPAEKLVIYAEATKNINEWRPAGFTTIQNHNATQLILIPENADDFFEQGQWRLTFTLNRTRYLTTDTGDDLASYIRHEQIDFGIP